MKRKKNWYLTDMDRNIIRGFNTFKEAKIDYSLTKCKRPYGKGFYHCKDDSGRELYVMTPKKARWHGFEDILD